MVVSQENGTPDYGEFQKGTPNFGETQIEVNPEP